MVGTQIAQYRVLSLIGQGGMGVVYLAEDSILRRKVALKFVLGRLAEDDSARKRLLSEARAAAALDHPFICKVYETGQLADQPFIVMEYVAGVTLRDRAAAAAVSIDAALRITGEIAEALGYAHKRGIIHRDLKPSNVLVTEDGHIKVMDFGIAKRVAADSSAVTISLTSLAPRDHGAGTPAYMSPEQVGDEALDARSDIFALGILLYELLSGRHPFKRSSAAETFHAILFESPPPISEVVPNAPVQLDSIVAKLLAKEKDQRYESLEQLRSDLSGATAAAAPHRLAVSPSRASVRRAAALALFVLAAGAGGFRVFNNDDVIAFANRDWLLVSGFENQTGDEVFDRTLDTALGVAMGQSSYVNLLPPSRIAGALQRMKLPAGQKVDEPLARQIAQREGLKIVLVPRISKIGAVYQLSGSIEDAATGAVLKSAVVRVQRKEGVLHGIDELVGSIRDDLGEAGGSMSKMGKSLAAVTTDSLDALRIFSRAREAQTAARIDEALTLYEEALRLDPSFTAARAQLGMIHFELRDREYGKTLLAEAIKSVDELTDREKYSVLAFHALAVENSPQKAVDYYKAVLALYPDASSAHNNIGRAYMRMGRWDDAVKSLKHALSIEPDVMLTYNSLNQIYLYELGDLNAAIALCREQLARTDQNPYPYDYLGWAMLGKGEFSQARGAFEAALKINPRAVLDLYRLGHSYRLEQRYDAARETFLRIPAIDPSEDSAYYNAGVVSRLMGDESAALRDFVRFRGLVEQRIRKDPQIAGNYLELAAVLAHLRADPRAAVARGMALDPSQHFEYAVVLSIQRRADESIRQLQVAVEKGFRNFVWMRIHPDLEPLWSDPRFEKLIGDNLK
jgi:tetratricopeptide (TPR) repeat protein/tRNA A-37 threonylcarbamoyl transferase component Bud32